MNRITVLVTLVKGMLAGDKLCSITLTSADYRVVLDSIEADAKKSEEAAFEQPLPGEPISLLVRPETAEEMLQKIRVWLRGAKHVIVCDPYFFKPPIHSSFYTSDADYANRMLQLFGPEVKDVRIFCNGHTAAMKKLIWRPLKKGRQVQAISSNKIHDRFIIKDGQEGKMIGTSMQGFGGKIFAVLDLPTEDVSDLVSALRAIAKVGTKPWS